MSGSTLLEGSRRGGAWLRSVSSVLAPRWPHVSIDDLRAAMHRVFDVCFAVTALLATFPLFLVVATAVAISSPGPVFYAHPRMGHHGRSFPCLKFRTMRADAATILTHVLATDGDLAAEFAQTQKLRDDPRVTAVGRWLRRLSLDELPQFLNVLLGHMSVVGPRPVTSDELVHYGADANDLLSVRPGITGLWQVSGRSDLTYPERVTLDLHYVRSRNFAFDLRIIARTVRHLIVVRGNGAC